MKENEFIEWFDDAAKTMEKIFVPDMLDEKIVTNILVFLKNREEDESLAQLSAIKYMKYTTGMIVNIKDFANHFHDFFYEAKKDVDQEERIRKLLAETRLRMAGE